MTSVINKRSRMDSCLNMTNISHSSIENNVLSFLIYAVVEYSYLLLLKFSSNNHTIYKEQTADLF